MLNYLDFKDLDSVTNTNVPDAIQLKRNLRLPPALDEWRMLTELRGIAEKNKSYRSYIGMGYYDCIVPKVIIRNMLENTGWTSPYTPCQPDIVQGRLESLLNFQTMICDLTGLDVANASLLEEATAVAEAACSAASSTKRNTILYDKQFHPQNLAVLKTIAEPLDITLEPIDEIETPTITRDVACVIVQYPDTEGKIFDLQNLIGNTHNAGGLVISARRGHAGTKIIGILREDNVDSVLDYDLDDSNETFLGLSTNIPEEQVNFFFKHLDDHFGQRRGVHHISGTDLLAGINVPPNPRILVVTLTDKKEIQWNFAIFNLTDQNYICYFTRRGQRNNAITKVYNAVKNFYGHDYVRMNETIASRDLNDFGAELNSVILMLRICERFYAEEVIEILPKFEPEKELARLIELFSLIIDPEWNGPWPSTSPQPAADVDVEMIEVEEVSLPP